MPAPVSRVDAGFARCPARSFVGTSLEAAQPLQSCLHLPAALARHGSGPNESLGPMTQYIALHMSAYLYIMMLSRTFAASFAFGEQGVKMDQSNWFTIRKAAGDIGVHPATLRSWERAGLIPPATRRRGLRVYTAEDVGRIKAKMFRAPVPFKPSPLAKIG